MITSLTLENFMVWERIRELKLGKITALFGGNSTGKSSFLHALLLAKQTVESPDRRAVLDFGDDLSAVSLGRFSEIVRNHDVSRRIRLGMTWEPRQRLKIYNPEYVALRVLFEPNSLSFDVEISEDSKGVLQVEEFSYGLHSDDGLVEFGMRRHGERYETRSEGYDLRRSRGRPSKLPGPYKFFGFPDQVRSEYQNASFLSDLEFSFEDALQSIYYLGPLREHPRREYAWSGSEPADVGMRGELVINALLASRRLGPTISKLGGQPKQTLEQYVAWWLQKLELITDFSVKEIGDSGIYRVWVRVSSSDQEVLLSDVGFGVSQVLPVLALINHVPEGSVVVLEQPEIHLHPSVQAGLADALIDAVKKRGVQILLESHSEYLLRRIQRRIAEEVIAEQDVELYFTTKTRAGAEIEPLKVDMFGNISNWPKNFFGDELGELNRMLDAQLRRKSDAE